MQVLPAWYNNGSTILFQMLDRNHPCSFPTVSVKALEPTFALSVTGKFCRTVIEILLMVVFIFCCLQIPSHGKCTTPKRWDFLSYIGLPIIYDEAASFLHGDAFQIPWYGDSGLI